MLKMVDGTGIIGVDMICPLGVSTPQPPNYDRVELEGTGMLVLPNSLDAPLERLELGGKTEQVQTTGAQLFDIAKCPLEHNGVSFKIPKSSGDVVLMDGYVFEENTQYTISAQKSTSENVNSAVFKFEYVDGSRNEIKVKDIAKKSLTSMSGKTVKRFLVVNPFGAVDEVFNFQFEKGVTATPYEPYTGCKPSPSPEYPQEIKSVGRLNEDTGKYEIEISISGRNLFDFSTCEEGKIFEGSGNIVSAANGLLTDFIPCFPNSQYSRSRTGSTVVAFYDCDKNKIGFEIVGNTTFVTPEKCRYFRFSAVKTLVDYTKIVACPGQTVMDYEPYREPKFFTLTSDRPLTKWDRLVEQGGEIGWLYNTDKYIVTGQESFETKPSYVMEETVDFAFMNNKQSGIRKAADNFCNRLTYVDSVWSKHDVGFGISGVEVHIRLPLEAIGASSSDESAVIKTKFSEYLKKKYDGGGPFVFYHKSKTTEFIPLPQSEQNAIQALKTYYPTTVITADGGGLDPDIKVTYRKEI